LSGDHEKPQKKLLNYLLFGGLGYHLVETVLKSTKKDTPLPLPPDVIKLKPTKKQSLISTKEIAKSAENLNTIQPINKEISLDDLLFELIQETNKVTISQVVVQYLKINTKLEKSNLVLEIVVSIVNGYFYYNNINFNVSIKLLYFKILKLNDFLNGKIIPEDLSSSISLKSLYFKYKSASSLTNHLAASRLMLKKLGFKFFVDQSGKYMVKLPERSLEPKLRLISRCLLIFESNINI